MEESKLLNAPKVLRTHCYCMKPEVYDIACPICKKHNTHWSEFEKHLWCFDCEKDILLTLNDSGVFSGPIPMGVAGMFGMSFDRISIKDSKMVKFCDDGSSNEEFNKSWVRNEELEEYIKNLE